VGEFQQLFWRGRYCDFLPGAENTDFYRKEDNSWKFRNTQTSSAFSVTDTANTPINSSVMLDKRI